MFLFFINNKIKEFYVFFFFEERRIKEFYVMHGFIHESIAFSNFILFFF
jgi:hypothetical protein